MSPEFDRALNKMVETLSPGQLTHISNIFVESFDGSTSPGEAGFIFALTGKIKRRIREENRKRDKTIVQMKSINPRKSA
jgi:hypothetical protein